MSNFPSLSGSKLTQEELELLRQWSYDPQNNRMSTTASVRSGLNSFELNEMHTMHSGGSNVFFENNTTGVNWFPPWQGVKPLGAVGEHIGINPTVRQYSDVFELQPNGAFADTTNTTYTSTVTLVENESILKVEFIAGETYSGEIEYLIKNNNNLGIVKYRQTKQIDVVAGDPVEILFTHPSESQIGETIFVDILKDNNVSLLVRQTTTSTAPYIRLTLATYEDVDIVSATRFIVDSFTMRYAGDYEVDTSVNLGVNITIPSSFTQTFYVSDANQTFLPTQPCIVDFTAFGQGQVILQTSRDSYKFYYDHINSQWRFKNIDTKDGGIV